MKRLTPRARIALVTAVLVSSAACGRDNAPVLRIGEAISRTEPESTLVHVVQPLLDNSAPPRVEIAPWQASAPDLGIGETEQAQAFIADPLVVAAVGHAGSKGTLMTKHLYIAGGLPLIVPTATARAVGDTKAGVFALAPPDDAIGAFLVDEAARLGAKRIGILHIADAYGDGVRDGVLAQLRARGDSLAGSAALSGRECEDDGLAMDAIVHAFMSRSRPDVVITVLQQRSTWCTIRHLVRQHPEVLIITSDSYSYSSELPLTAAERERVYSLVFWRPGTDSLTQRFTERARRLLNHDPTPGDALTFDAHRLIVAAVRDGNITRESIARWLRELGTPGHPPFEGITGPIDFQKPRTKLLHLVPLRDTPAASNNR